MATAKDILEDAHMGIIGIDAEGNVFGGYDEKYPQASVQRPEYLDLEDWHPLSGAERHALADEMIKRWSDYKSRSTN